MSELEGLLSRLWADLIARPGGPLEFRFLLQPMVAAVLAVRDGLSDARAGRSPYFWTLVHDPAHRRERLREIEAQLGTNSRELDATLQQLIAEVRAARQPPRYH